jgi:phosphoribosylamine--glycine ligase
MSKNVLVIGSGGREHALALRISQSASVGKLFCLPGNPGTKKISSNVEINPSDFQAILDFCKKEKIDLVVIGPEQPLVEGLSDFLRENNFNVFGPSKFAAKIESSKSYAKKIMQKANVPTGKFKEFLKTEFDDTINYLKKSSYPIVLKADGLAAGKGVTICENYEIAKETLEEIFVKNIFGDSGKKIVVEEFLLGEEASIFAITDGKDFITLPPAQDHKRIGDNDTGKNTGGMGSYAPTPLITQELINEIDNNIISPTLKQMKDEGFHFVGCLYAGLIITADGPKVIEFNCRFGDPETQVVLPLLEGDFLELLYSAAIGSLNKNSITYNGGSSVCIVAASKGYPDSYQKGFEIFGLEDLPADIIVYHAGTTEINNKILTNSGRVLGVTSVIKENNILLAQQKAYESISKICFDGIHYRKDIANRVTKYLNLTKD